MTPRQHSELGARPPGSVPAWGPPVFLALIVLHVLQSVALYRGGTTPEEWTALSPRAQDGLGIFRKNACHACHQVHGLGGFLGPDLTNVIRRRTPEEIGQVITSGRRQMPAFALNESDLEALTAYVTELDRTGTSTAAWRLPAVDAVHWPTRFAFTPGRTANAPPAVRRGEELVNASGCVSCHRPFTVGVAGAPDLTLTRSRRDRRDANSQIAAGRGAMPGFSHLSPEQRRDMVEYVWWLGEHRARLARGIAGPGPEFRWGDVPWFTIR